jgi:hypothetical protein
MKLIQYIKTQLGVRQLVGITLGLIAGYGYWYFYVCTEGCTITGSALNSSLYFGMMGYFASGLIPVKKEVGESATEDKNPAKPE